MSKKENLPDFEPDLYAVDPALWKQLYISLTAMERVTTKQGNTNQILDKNEIIESAKRRIAHAKERSARIGMRISKKDKLSHKIAIIFKEIKSRLSHAWYALKGGECD